MNIQRTGKNLLDTTAITQYSSWSNSEYGGTYGSNNVNRTFTISTKAGQTYTLTVKTADHSAVPQYISFCKSNSSKDETSIVDRFTTDSWQKDSYTFTAEADTYYYLRMGLTGTEGNFTTQVSKISYFQLELGSTDTAYEPYTGTTYPISWQTEAGTVYGGSLDVTTGVLTVTHGIIDMSVVNWIRDNNRAGVFYGGITGRSISSDVLACSCYKVDNISVSTSKDAYISGVMSYGGNMVFFRDTTLAGKTRQEVQTARSGETIVYELATPQTYQLTPTEVQMLLGNNVIWNDVGDMVLEYLADGPADDIDALQILLGNRYVNNGEPDEATDKEALEILLGGNTR